MKKKLVNKKLRARTAVALAVVMTAANITSLAAVDTGFLPGDGEFTEIFIGDGGRGYLAGTHDQHRDSTSSNADKAAGNTLDGGAEGEFGDSIFWELDTEGVLTVSGQGAMPQVNYTDQIPWYSHRGKIRKAVIEQGITTVAAYTFWECANLTEAEIPDTVTSIGNYGFYGCASLSDIKVPDTVVSIGKRAFDGCDNLPAGTPIAMGTVGEKDNIRWKVDSEGTMTISGKGEMPDARYSGSWPWSDYAATVKKIVVEDGVTCLGNYSFQGFGELTSVILPGSLARIGDYAFADCGKLADIQIPDSVTTIGKDAFRGCVSLENVMIVAKGAYGDNLWWELDNKGTLTVHGQGDMSEERYGAPWRSESENIRKAVIGEGVTNIGYRAFYDCKKLEAIEISKTVTAIEDYAFSGCESLADIQVPDTVISIAAKAFYGCAVLPGEVPVSRGIYKDNFTWNLTGDGTLTLGGTGDLPNQRSWYQINSHEDVKKLIIKEGITGIPRSAFMNYKNMTDVALPESLTAMGSEAFISCGLTSVVIPEKITVIETDTFSGCADLASVTLPEGLKEIKRRAFAGTGIPSVEIPEAVVELAQMAFPVETKLIFKKTGSLTGTPLKETSATNFLATDNQSQQAYGTWSRVVRSYLYEGEDGGLYRAEYGPDSKKMVIEQYGSDFKLAKSWNVPMELPVFGGFYEGEENLYAVFGQKNEKEDDQAEVFRIVKYTKDMERLDSVSFYGMNTVVPFDAGSLRMAENGRELFVRTAHTMYRSSDNLRHQANVTLAVNKEAMTRSYMNYWVSNNSTGYVSHSFNQFIKVDGDRVVAVDHGDGYPRGAALTIYKADDLMDGPQMYLVFPVGGGKPGDNYTGLSIGGLEISQSSYLIACSSIDQRDYGNSTEDNIYLIAVDKDDESFTPRTVQITDYAQGSRHYASTPQLVKISEDLFAVMWEEGNRGGTVKTVFFDGEGNRLGDSSVGSFEGSLSDCQPVVYDGDVVWYATDGKNLTFYTFPAEFPGSASNLQVSKTVLKGKGGSGSGSGGSSGGSGGGSGSGGGGGSSSGGSSGGGSSSGGSGGGGSSSGGSGGGTSSSGGSGGGSSAGPGGGSSGSFGGSGTVSGGNAPGSAPTVWGTWQRDGSGWWLQTANGSYPKSQWAKINGATYLFNDSGYMVEGWTYLNNCWYYLTPGSGAMATGWIQPGGFWYYLGGDGVMATGWIQLGGVWYYLNGDGSMATGWIQLSGVWYYLGENGAMATGWIQVGGKWYYLDESGAMLANTITPDGYGVGADGALLQ